MSTAHRPTWNPAHGGDSQSGNRFLAPRTAFSSKDLPRHLTVKQRQPGSGPQSASELKRQLEERENTARDGKPLQPRPPAEQLLDFSALEGARRPAATAPAVEEEEEESDEEDETEELMRELERIKKERALEAMRIAAESDEAAAAERTEQILHGNPLVQPPASVAGPAAGSFNVKRRWDDDVVFRNQARKPEKNEPIFINDTLRTEFHKRFLKKYIK
ncbi:protein CWC15 A [Pavlovales sp. CCMP2436]|nr:protein CWC15 A [Pavlovales sp. CCMP2436]